MEIKYNTQRVDSVSFRIHFDIYMGMGGFDHGEWVNSTGLTENAIELIEIIRQFPGFMGVLSYGYYVGFGHGILFNQEDYHNKVLEAIEYVYRTKPILVSPQSLNNISVRKQEPPTLQEVVD